MGCQTWGLKQIYLTLARHSGVLGNPVVQIQGIIRLMINCAHQVKPAVDKILSTPRPVLVCNRWIGKEDIGCSYFVSSEHLGSVFALQLLKTIWGHLVTKSQIISSNRYVRACPPWILHRSLYRIVRLKVFLNLLQEIRDGTQWFIDHHEIVSLPLLLLLHPRSVSPTVVWQLWPHRSLTQSLISSCFLHLKSTLHRVTINLRIRNPWRAVRLFNCFLPIRRPLIIDLKSIGKIIHDINHLTQFVVDILHVTLEFMVVLAIVELLSRGRLVQTVPSFSLFVECFLVLLVLNVLSFIIYWVRSHRNPYLIFSIGIEVELITIAHSLVICERQKLVR